MLLVSRLSLSTFGNTFTSHVDKSLVYKLASHKHTAIKSFTAPFITVLRHSFQTVEDVLQWAVPTAYQSGNFDGMLGTDDKDNGS